MPIPNFYSIWVDPFFYIAAAIFVTALILLVYSVKRYIEMENKAGFSAEGACVDNVISPAVCQMEEDAGHAEPGVENIAAVDSNIRQKQTLQEEIEQSGSKAEIFLKGVHDNLLSLDERLKNIETVLAKNKSTVNFTIEYLEDLIEKMDEIDKEKIKSRLEYLINNFLKH
jgi:hypothetical protein